jgi:hypothetical protein
MATKSRIPWCLKCSEISMNSLADKAELMGMKIYFDEISQNFEVRGIFRDFCSK